MSQLIIYGRGINAAEYCRYLRNQGRGEDVVCFAVTSLDGQGENFCGLPCLEIDQALKKFPTAEIHLALQEKYHREVIELLQERGRIPEEIIGLRRMMELLGEQAQKQIVSDFPELIVRKNPYDFSTLEITSPGHPGKKYTFYPMCQVPLGKEDLKHIRDYFYAEDLYIAMATSGKDARVRWEHLPNYVHAVLGGASFCKEPRPQGIEYDDEKSDNISSYNDIYSELTVAYWLWQKAPKAKYLGLCHYRRHFVLTEEINELLSAGRIDVILTRPRLTFPSVREFFTDLPVTYTDSLDYETMLRLLGRHDEKMAAYAREFLAGQVQFPNNMVIAKRKIYLAYCEFMFTILLSMQEHYFAENIARPKRYLGNVGEMLTAVYFAYHRDRWRTEYVDYQLLEEEL